MPSDIKNTVRKAGRAIGRVQGVCFRAFVRREAKKLGLTGWVKNMSDGSVTMELQGESLIIEQLIKKIKIGKGRINVTGFELSDLPVLEGENNFAIRY